MPISEAREAKLSKAGLGPEATERGGDSGVFSGASIGSSASDGKRGSQIMGSSQVAEAKAATAAKDSARPSFLANILSKGKTSEKERSENPASPPKVER